MKLNQRKKYYVIALIFAVLVIVTMMITIGMQYYHISDSAGDIMDVVEYQGYFVMIVDESENLFWEDVYGYAKEKASECGYYLELMGIDNSYDYTKEELLDRSIAAHVDGILLQGGESNLIEGIQKAIDAGIPVVTILDDSPDSVRNSYVGVSNYDLGQEYRKNIELLSGKGIEEFVVLLEANAEDSSKNLIYTSIIDATKDWDIQVESYSIVSDSTFQIDENIRNIIIQNEVEIDAIICTTPNQTNSVYQSVISYNKVGKIVVIGYSSEETILEAVEKNIVDSTIIIDSFIFGESCIETLYGLTQGNRVSEYITIPIRSIHQDNLEDYQLGQ